MAQPGGEHGIVAGRALRRLGAFLDQRPEVGGNLFTAETGFRLARDPDTVRAPDVAYVSEARLSQARVPGYPELAPDLVVEVVSPGDTPGAMQAKAEEWLRAGARQLWATDPTTRSAMVYRPDGSAQLPHDEDTLTGDPVLPGFAIRLGEMF